jgi:hypothetical protein
LEIVAKLHVTMRAIGRRGCDRFTGAKVRERLNRIVFA